MSAAQKDAAAIDAILASGPTAAAEAKLREKLAEQPSSLLYRSIVYLLLDRQTVVSDLQAAVRAGVEGAARFPDCLLLRYALGLACAVTLRMTAKADCGSTVWRCLRDSANDAANAMKNPVPVSASARGCVHHGVASLGLTRGVALQGRRSRARQERRRTSSATRPSTGAETSSTSHSCTALLASQHLSIWGEH